MTPTDAEIIAEFERIETERGGQKKANAWECLCDAAKALGVSEKRARDVMVNHWLHVG